MWIAIASIGLLLFSAPTAGQSAVQEEPGTLRSIEDLELPSRWAANLDGIEQNLEKGRTEAARRAARKLAERALGRVTSDDRLANIVGVALLFEARAHFAQGRRDRAMWTWQTAQLMAPDVRGIDLSVFGKAGEFLDSEPRVGDPAYHRQWQGRALESYRAPGEPTRPEAISRKIPNPYGGSGRGSYIEIGSIIDPEGRVRRPYLLDFRGRPASVLDGLDALREWRFEPSRSDGKAVPILFTLTLRFG